MSENCEARPTSRLYGDRDAEVLGDYYLRNVLAMTAEGLHDKSKIAAELAWRDAEIDRLKNSQFEVRWREVMLAVGNGQELTLANLNPEKRWFQAFIRLLDNSLVIGELGRDPFNAFDNLERELKASAPKSQLQTGTQSGSGVARCRFCDRNDRPLGSMAVYSYKQSYGGFTGVCKECFADPKAEARRQQRMEKQAMETETKKDISQPMSTPPDPKQMTPQHLVELALQKYACACSEGCSQDLHEWAMTLKVELLRRLTDGLKDKSRLHWLHDCSTGQIDKDGYEWGIYRVKWKNGQAVSVMQTNSDLSDLDAEMAREMNAPDASLP